MQEKTHAMKARLRQYHLKHLLDRAAGAARNELMQDPKALEG